MTVSESRLRVVVPTESVATASELPGLRITGEAGALVMATTIVVADQPYPVTAGLDVTVSDAALVLRSGEVTGDGIDLPAEVAAGIGTLIDLTVPLDDLPVTVTGGSVTASGTALVVLATAGNLQMVGP